MAAVIRTFRVEVLVDDRVNEQGVERVNDALDMKEHAVVAALDDCADRLYDILDRELGERYAEVRLFDLVTIRGRFHE